MDSIAGAKRDNTHPSCDVCQRRKVKCNRIYPCAACKKSGLDCSFSLSPKKRPRRSVPARNAKSSPNSVKQTSSHDPSTESSAIDPPWPSPDSTSSAQAPGAARLVSDGEGYRYVNNYIWNSLPKQTDDIGVNSHATFASERRYNEDGLGQPCTRADRPYGQAVEKSFIFGSHVINDAPSQLPPDQIIALWQNYIQRVDPLFKIFHAPSVQQLVLGQIGKSALPVHDHCLVVSTYLISAVSMTDQECWDTIKTSRDRLISSFRDATERSLSAAGFVTTTDIIVLQALVLFIAALRSLGETQTVWSLSGMAIRIARSIGLARDGIALNLSPFEIEMRRRLWWALVYVDSRTSELIGQDDDLLVQSFDVELPSNISDGDLFPSMKNLPAPRTWATDATYIVWRANLGLQLRSIRGLSSMTRKWPAMCVSEADSSETINAIQKLEQETLLESLKQCDSSVPLQFLSLNATKTVLSKLYLIAKSSQQTEDTYSSEVFKLSMELMEIHLALWSEPSLHQWQWYWIGYFQWYGLACLIRQTRLCPSESEAVKGWTMVRKVFDKIIPTVDIGPKKSLLLEGIRALLNTAMNGGDTEVANEKPSDKTLPKQSQNSSTVIGMQGRVTLSGSQPHSALLPGMSTEPLPDASIIEDSLIDFDINAVDWDEFDRLAAELYQQDLPDPIPALSGWP